MEERKQGMVFMVLTKGAVPLKRGKYIWLHPFLCITPVRKRFREHGKKFSDLFTNFKLNLDLEILFRSVKSISQFFFGSAAGRASFLIFVEDQKLTKILHSAIVNRTPVILRQDEVHARYGFIRNILHYEYECFKLSDWLGNSCCERIS